MRDDDQKIRTYLLQDPPEPHWHHAEPAYTQVPWNGAPHQAAHHTADAWQAILLVLLALGTLGLGAYLRAVSQPPPAPVGIDPVTAPAEDRFQKAQDYRKEGDRLRQAGLDGWDDKSILNEALAHYRISWLLLTGNAWITETTWYSARDYTRNDGAVPTVHNSDADLLQQVLRERIIEMEDATDTCGLW